MRPRPTRDATVRDTLPCAPTSAPMACFIASESDIDHVRDRSRPRFPGQHDRRKARNTSHPSQAANLWSSPTRAEGSVSSTSDADQDMLHDLSRPDTPLLAGFSGLESVFSSSSSRRSSIAISSAEVQSSHMDDPALSSHPGVIDGRGAEDDLVPQLIMPSLTVPRRRPFSDVGKSLGKLKVMVAGRSGIGKTSLIRSLVQHCEHIVHIDPLEPNRTGRVAEIYASSRPHPWWRADSEELATSIGRRTSLTGEMLDRNVCFVEFPCNRNAPGSSKRDLQYVESHLNRLLIKPMNDCDLLALLNAGGEPIVDVLLYLIPHSGLTTADIEYIRIAQGMTNVIPLLARADELSGHDLELAKQHMAQRLVDEGLDCFSFAEPDSVDDDLQVFAVSSETQPDYDTIDASILMNSDYIQPLVPTDLGRLVDRLFSLDGSARLRHSAALKTIRWRHDHGTGVLQRTCQPQVRSARFMPDPYYNARYFTHSRFWDRVELFNWAHSLRQSLQSERLSNLMAAGFDEKSGNPESCLVPMNTRDAKQAARRHKKSNPRSQDPLGLLELGAKLKQTGLLALEMLSSLGLVGFVISRLSEPAWTCGSPHGSLVRRVGMDVAGLGSLLS